MAREPLAALSLVSRDSETYCNFCIVLYMFSSLEFNEVL